MNKTEVQEFGNDIGSWDWFADLENRVPAISATQLMDKPIEPTLQVINFAILINPYVEGTDQIDPDLFPDDFIYCLPTPTNYIGSEKLFRDDSTTGQVIPIKAEDVKNAFPFKHKKEQDIVELPATLKDAIRYYVSAYIS